jgi:taurine dioxygenase
MEEVAVARDSFSMRPLSAHTGAEIAGIDLSSPVDEQTRKKLNHAFLDRSVIAVRNQKLNAPQFLEAMKIFGEVFLQHNPRFAVPECPQIHYISNQDKLEDGRVYIPGEGYHTDHSNDVEPPKATALHAVKLPKTGGDTQFVNMYEAYDALPEDMKKRIDGLQARHVYQSKYSERKLPGLSEERKKIASESVVHPSSERIRRQDARRSTSIQSVSKRLSECQNRKRCRCSMSFSNTQPRRDSSTATNGRPAIS